MALVVCDQVSEGLRESEKTVAIKDVQGRRQFLRVDKDFLTPGKCGKSYITVGVVGVDQSQKVALIELPHEADSGTSRLWVHLSDLMNPREVAV